MKKILFALIALVGVVVVASCDDTETYAEQRERENAAISRYINENKIRVLN